MDPFILGSLALGAAVTGTTAIQSRRARRAAEAERRRLAAQPKPTPGQLATRQALALKPELFDWDFCQFVRGGHRTTPDAIAAFYRRYAPQAHLLNVADTVHPLLRLLNLLTIFTGLAGTGKTSVMLNLLYDLCQVCFSGVLPSYRLCVLDPVGVFGSLLRHALPQHVSLFDFSLTHRDGVGWATYLDIRDPVDWENFVRWLIPQALRQGSDPFWPASATTYLVGIIDCLDYFGVPWTFGTLMRLLSDSGVSRALLLANPRTRSWARLTLFEKLGQSIAATTNGYVRQMFVAGGYDRQIPSERRLSMKAFLDAPFAAMTLSYHPKLVASTSGFGNALVRTLVAEALTRRVLPGQSYTTLFLDESRYAADLSGIDELAYRGRQAGLGAFVSSIGLPSLEQSWSKPRADEFRSLANAWFTMAADPVTARAFSERCGRYEALVTAHSTGQGISGGWSQTWSQHNSYSVNGGWNQSTGTSTAYHLRDVVLDAEVLALSTPSNPAMPDVAHFFGVSADTGAFRGVTDLAAHRRRIGPVPEYLPAERPALRDGPVTADELLALGIDPTQGPLAAHFNGPAKP